MLSKVQKIRLPLFCILLSLLVHLLAVNSLGWFGRFDLSLAIRQPPAATIDVALSSPPPPAAQGGTAPGNAAEMPRDEAVTAAAVPAEGVGSDLDNGENQGAESSLRSKTAPPRSIEPNVGIGGDETKTGGALPPGTKQKAADDVGKPPLRTSGEFLGTSHEKLVYRISMLGLPVGSAELEANNEAGELRIALRVRSDAVLTAIYPVDDLIETRHVGGNFILSRIRQREGAFRGDRGFTLFLREKSVFWIDRLTNRSLREPLPNPEVLDILSGLYLLRSRPLRVGTPETLHIYDSDSYAAVPVDVIRRETVRLPVFREVEALLLQPQLKTGGIFRRTGDVRIWLSADRYKVPVKIVTSIALGEVTAELVSSESEPPDAQ